MYFLTVETKGYCNKEMPKAGSDYTCLAVVNVDSALKKHEHLQAFLKECKYIEKEAIRLKANNFFLATLTKNNSYF